MVHFRYDKKLSKIPLLLSRERKQCPKGEKKWVECTKGVVYTIKFSCGFVYTGQTGACLNKRLEQHHYSISHTKNTQRNCSSQNQDEEKFVNYRLVEHLSKCVGCVAKFEETVVRARSHSKIVREVFEAFTIRKESENTVSEASVRIADSEIKRLEEKQ
jgi:predicted GIY-YIG superfamily endonuclease